MKAALILVFGSCLSAFAGDFTIPLAPVTDDRGSTSIANASYDYFTCDENAGGFGLCPAQYPYKTDAPQQVGTDGFEVTRSVTLQLPTGYAGGIDPGTSVAIDDEWGIQQSAFGWETFANPFLETLTVSSGGASMIVAGSGPPIAGDSFLSDDVLTPDILAALNAGDPLAVSVDEFLGPSGASQLYPDISPANLLTESTIPCGVDGEDSGTCTITEYLESAQLSMDPSLTATLTMQTPLPEPGSILLCFAALPAAGLVVRRRRANRESIRSRVTRTSSVSTRTSRFRVDRGFGSCYKQNCMDKTIRKYSNPDEMKADEYRYWQSRPVHERLAAVSELTEEGYKLKGFKPDAFRLQRTLVHFQRAPR